LRAPKAESIEVHSITLRHGKDWGQNELEWLEAFAEIVMCKTHNVHQRR